MDTTVLVNQIKLLPVEMQQQVADFVEFLVLKYKGKNAPVEEFTDEEKEELLRIWEEYERHPEDVISLEDAIEQTKAKYGL